MDDKLKITHVKIISKCNKSHDNNHFYRLLLNFFLNPLVNVKKGKVFLSINTANNM